MARLYAIGKSKTGKTVYSANKPSAPKPSQFKSHRDYSKASYLYSKSKRADTIAKVKAGKSLSSSELKGAGVQSTKSGGYKYYDSATQKYVTTEAPKVETKVAPTADKKWYYDPVLRITSTKAVEGQQAMTKQEALNVIRRMPKETKTEYATQYKQYESAKKQVEEYQQKSNDSKMLRKPLSLQEALSSKQKSWGPRISNLPPEPSYFGGTTYTKEVSKPTLLHTTKRYGMELPIVEITPEWLKDITSRTEQKAEKKTGVGGQAAMFGAAALSGVGTYFSVVTNPFKALKGFGSFIKAGVTDPFGTGVAIKQELTTRPVSMIADIFATGKAFKTYGAVAKPVVKYVKPEITTLKVPTDKGKTTVYKGFSIFERPVIGYSGGKIKLGTPGGVDLSVASKPFIVESAAGTKILLKNMGKQDLILSKQLSGSASGVGLYSEAKPGGFDLLQKQFEGYQFKVSPSGKSVITTSGQLMSPTELTKFGGLITKTRTVESTPSKFVVDKFLKQSRTWNEAELTKILDFTKRSKGELFGSFPAQQQTKPSLRRVPADVDIRFEMPKEELVLKAQELTKELKKMGSLVKIESDTALIEKWIPEQKGYVHGVDIHTKNFEDLSQDASDLASDMVTGDKIYGAPLDQPTIKIEDVKVMPLSEQVVRKMSSIATIRPGQPGESWTIAPEAHRMKDIPDWFAGYETLSGKQALDLRGLYPTDLFKDYGKGIAGKIPLYKYTQPAFKYPSGYSFLGLTKKTKYPSYFDKTSFLSKVQDYKLDYKIKYPKTTPSTTYPSYPSKALKYPSYPSRVLTYPSKAGGYPSRTTPYKHPSSYQPSSKAPSKSPYIPRSPSPPSPYTPRSPSPPSPPSPYKPPPPYPYSSRYYGEETPPPPPPTFPKYYPKTIKQTPFYKGKKKKLKEFKFKYSPSLVAGLKKITTKEMKIPKHLTGVGIRPVKRKK